MINDRRLQPAEWTPHEAVWIGWPSSPKEWGDALGPARAEIEDFIRAILFPGGDARGERVDLLARGPEAMASAEIMQSRLPDPSLLRLHEAPIGDIWLRDTGPIFADQGGLVASAFRFNGWGGKYVMPDDHLVSRFVAEKTGVRLRLFEDFVGEGGALETDGEGTFITTRQCLLNKNRNPSMSERDADAVLKAALGAQKVIWLDEGLAGDHTDGHVDNLARFIAPGKVICMRPCDNNDPNTDVLKKIERQLSRERDASDRQLDVIVAPSPGRVDMNGAPAAASHMNFYVSNEAVIMPSYAGLSGRHGPAEETLELLQAYAGRPHCFAIESNHLLTGGGSFHCISQQQPSFR